MEAHGFPIPGSTFPAANVEFSRRQAQQMTLQLAWGNDRLENRLSIGWLWTTTIFNG